MTTVIIAGSRCIKDKQLVFDCIAQSKLNITEVVSGKQRTYDEHKNIIGGVDYWGEVWAGEHRVPISGFPAAWGRLGKAAGPIRNGEMARYAKQKEGVLLLIWNGKSAGSASMKREAQKVGLPIVEFIV